MERRWTLQLDERFSHRDVTDDVASVVADAGIATGIACVSVTGSTGAVTTIEYEPGALADLQTALERLAPEGDLYQHNERWGDGNGFSHVRSALLKTSITVPVIAGRLRLGTWQQIVVINLDNRARSREVAVVVAGD